MALRVVQKHECDPERQFFENAKISPLTILKIAYAYLVNKVNYRGISRMIMGAPRSESLLDWIQFCRDVLSADLIQETRIQKLGGPGKVVVVDETALAKRKYNRGQVMARETIWVLGMYDVDAKLGQLVWIENRSHQAIIPKIEQYVAEGSEIRRAADISVPRGPGLPGQDGEPLSRIRVRRRYTHKPHRRLLFKNEKVPTQEERPQSTQHPSVHGRVHVDGQAPRHLGRLHPCTPAPVPVLASLPGTEVAVSRKCPAHVICEYLTISQRVPMIRFYLVVFFAYCDSLCAMPIAHDS